MTASPRGRITSPSASMLHTMWHPKLEISMRSIPVALIVTCSTFLPAAWPQDQPPAASRDLSPRGLVNVAAAARLLAYVRFFHPSDQVAAVQAWDHLAIQVIEQAEPATDAADLARRLQESFAPIAPTLGLWAGGAENAPAVSATPPGAQGLASVRNIGAGAVAQKGRVNAYSSKVIRKSFSAAPGEEPRAACFRDKPLGESGVWCRLPIEVYYDEEGTLPHASAPPEWASLDGKPKLTALNRSTRLAGVSLCWGVMQHFYPYFDVVDTDWDAALGVALSKAAQDEDERTYLRTLRVLISKLHDGHGNVWSPAVWPQTMIPLALAWAGEDLVVVGKHDSVPAEVKIGDVILSIDDKASSACYEEVSRETSAATDGWQRYVSLPALVFDLPTSDPVPLVLRHPDGSEYSVPVARIPPMAIEDATHEKPEDGAELVPGIVYFDLDAAPADAFKKAMPALSSARGIVFDLRGYPDSGAMVLLEHLIGEAATSARWNVPIVTLPDHEGWTEWDTGGRWNIQPARPRLTAAVAFLTDGSAISYAESIMGVVEAYGLGEIVGSPTAGTNGNVNPFVLPGGYTVSWTGMKVLKHDGSQHHGVGIKPTVPVVPTAGGIAEGRDEVLEKAVDVLAAKIAESDR